MSIFPKSNNFKFAAVTTTYGLKTDLHVSVRLDGQVNRLVIDDFYSSHLPRHVFGVAIRKACHDFLELWYSSNCPSPASDYLRLMALENYKPWLVIQMGRKLGRTYSTSEPFMCDGSLVQWVCRMRTIGKPEAEKLYPNIVPQHITDNHPLFKSVNEKQLEGLMKSGRAMFEANPVTGVNFIEEEMYRERW